jgi:hypothetical protein
MSYFASKNIQGNYCNWRKSFKEACLRKVQHYLPSWNEEKTLAALVPLTLLSKNHNLPANKKKDEKEGGEKRKIRVHPVIMQMYNTRGGGLCEERRGRGWGLFLYSAFT